MHLRELYKIPGCAAFCFDDLFRKRDRLKGGTQSRQAWGKSKYIEVSFFPLVNEKNFRRDLFMIAVSAEKNWYLVRSLWNMLQYRCSRAQKITNVSSFITAFSRKNFTAYIIHEIAQARIEEELKAQ